MTGSNITYTCLSVGGGDVDGMGGDGDDLLQFRNFVRKSFLSFFFFSCFCA
jgi:hypothetical protein